MLAENDTCRATKVSGSLFRPAQPHAALCCVAGAAGLSAALACGAAGGAGGNGGCSLQSAAVLLLVSTCRRFLQAYHPACNLSQRTAHVQARGGGPAADDAALAKGSPAIS